MTDDASRVAELAELAALCRELAALGLNVGLSDARPAVSVYAGAGMPPLWITAAGECSCGVRTRGARSALPGKRPAGSPPT